jgi:hypothetical protein
MFRPLRGLWHLDSKSLGLRQLHSLVGQVPLGQDGKTVANIYG